MGWTPALWWNAWRLIVRDVYYLYVFVWFCYWFIRRSLSPLLVTYPSWKRLTQSYVGDYLKEEIAAEALARNIPSFSRFLEVAALSNGEIVDYTNMARECGITSPKVKEYFQILEDTLIGRQLPAFQKRIKRRLVTSPKFYFFDLSSVIHLSRRGKVVPGSELFGRAFEHYIWMEIVAHSSYSELFYPISYWRTASGFEVDFILGDHEIAIEAKSTELANTTHLKGLRRFKEEHSVRRSILVSLDSKPRKTQDQIEILPWQIFLEQLWGGKVVWTRISQGFLKSVTVPVIASDSEAIFWWGDCFVASLLAMTFWEPCEIRDYWNEQKLNSPRRG